VYLNVILLARHACCFGYTCIFCFFLFFLLFPLETSYLGMYQTNLIKFLEWIDLWVEMNDLIFFILPKEYRLGNHFLGQIGLIPPTFITLAFQNRLEIAMPV